MNEEKNRELLLTELSSQLISICMEYSGDSVEGVFAELMFYEEELSCGILYAVNQGIFDMESLPEELPGCEGSSQRQNQYRDKAVSKAAELARLLKEDGSLPGGLRLFFNNEKNELKLKFLPENEQGSPVHSPELTELWIKDIQNFLEKGEEYMDFNEKLVPLGSVVLLKGGVQKMLVIARGIQVLQGGKTVVFDYGGVLYPDGLTGDKMAYFNRESISKVYFLGYNDEDNRITAANIDRYLAENPAAVRGDVNNPDIGV